MAQQLDPPNDNPGSGTPGDPGYVPPTGTDTKIAVVVTGTSHTFTADQIVAAGGPWAAFKVKVTPANNNGSGTPAEAEYPA